MMNLPNKLTLSRIVILPFFIFFLLVDQLIQSPGLIFAARVIALILYIAVTKWIDSRQEAAGS